MITFGTFGDRETLAATRATKAICTIPRNHPTWCQTKAILTLTGGM